MDDTDQEIIRGSPLDLRPPPRSKAKLPSGEVVKLVAETMTGLPVTDEDAKALKEITDDEAAAAFMEAKFASDFDMKKLVARDAFATWLCRKIKVGPVLLTMHMQSLAECEAAIQFARDGLTKKYEIALTPEQENAMRRTLVWALEVQSKMIAKAHKTALDVAPNPNAPKRPKNLPPSIHTTNVLVQTSGADTAQR
jgi:hypothetical protein